MFVVNKNFSTMVDLERKVSNHIVYG